MTRLVLTNAIYFKGNWMFPFDPDSTETTTFYRADGSETECQMMQMAELEHAVEVDEFDVRPDTNATYYYNDYLQAVSLPYGRGDFRMTIMAPNVRRDPTPTVETLIDSLTLENWNEILAGLHPARFYVGLPRFKFGYEVNLTEILKTLGMEIAFDPGGADFSNMFADGYGWIGMVKQKTFVQVDERGTEAAAVTQVNFETSAPPHIVCDRPFLIVIHEDVSGAIMFIGKIANPVWED